MAAIVLLVFDVIFLRNPYKCFFTDALTNNCDLSTDFFLDSSWNIEGSYHSIVTYKIPAIKAQLAGAVLMLVTAILYIAIYIVTVIGVRPANTTNIYPTQPVISRIADPRPLPSLEAVEKPYRHVVPVIPQPAQSSASENEIVCHNCHYRIPLSVITVI